MSSLMPVSAQTVYFDRAYELTVVPFGQTQGATYSNVGTGRVGLKVAFEIERSFQAQADKGKIAVFNLAPATRNAIVRGSTVFLKAGYAGNPKLIFTGFVRKVTTERNGPDIVTSLECGDGEPSMTFGKVNRSYTSSVTLARILQDLAADFNLEIGGNVVSVSVGVVKGIPVKTYPNGIVLEGAVRTVLARLLRPLRIAWTIQNGKLLILPQNGTICVNALSITPTSGLINTPGYNEKYLTFSSLLNASLVPGGYINLQSSNKKLNGSYRVALSKFTGDTHGPPWQVDCQAEALTQPLPVLPTSAGTDFSSAQDADSEGDDE